MSRIRLWPRIADIGLAVSSISCVSAKSIISAESSWFCDCEKFRALILRLAAERGERHADQRQSAEHAQDHDQDDAPAPEREDARLRSIHELLPAPHDPIRPRRSLEGDQSLLLKSWRMVNTLICSFRGSTSRIWIWMPRSGSG